MQMLQGWLTMLVQGWLGLAVADNGLSWLTMIDDGRQSGDRLDCERPTFPYSKNNCCTCLIMLAQG